MIAIITAAVVVFSLASLKFFSAPYIWIALCWALFFLLATKLTANLSLRPVLFNISVIILAIGAYEAYLWINRPMEYRFEYVSTKGKSFGVKHDFLGYAPRKDDKIIARKYYGNELIYEAIYTIDHQGLRISPNYKEGHNSKCILFFGGSYVFGLGLNDNETLPYQTAINTNFGYRIYNFGFAGYGAHQMLSALEHGLVYRVIRCMPENVIYEAIIDHIPRAAGFYSWNKYGPKYIIDQNGKIVYQGNFDGAHSDNTNKKTSTFYRLKQKIMIQLRKSLVLTKIIERQRSINKDDIELFVRIVAKSNSFVKSRYPEAKFHLILWDQGLIDKSEMTKLLSDLKNHEIEIHLISEIIPGIFGKNSVKYKISELDGHPSALANREIAKYVANIIIAK